MKQVRFEQTGVPDFEQLLVSPDLSKTALKGLLMQYEKKRKKLEEELEEYRKGDVKIKSKMAEVTEATREVDEELKEFRKENQTIKTLQAHVTLLTQERDSAVSMWSAAEKELQRIKKELDSPRDNPKIQFLVKEMQTMQRDYSDAIHLLEGKLEKKKAEHEALLLYRENSNKDLDLARQQSEKLADEVRRLEREAARASGEREEMSEALEKCLTRVEHALRLEEQARTKVEDAVDLAHQALRNQDSASEAREKVEREMQLLTETTNLKLQQETNNFAERLRLLEASLNKARSEKKKVHDELERVKTACYSKLHEVIEKNKKLSAQYKEAQNRSVTEKRQWNEERKMLRTQILTLQGCVEQVNVNLRENKYQLACKRCTEIRRKAIIYKKIASRWRKTAHELQEKLGQRVR